MRYEVFLQIVHFDILKEYAEKPNELDVENEYQEIYLNNPKLFDGDEDVGKILKNKYKKQIKLKENNTSENIDVKCILRQLNKYIKIMV